MHSIGISISEIEMPSPDFQDKSGCSINGFRSFLFEEGIVRDLYDMERLLSNSSYIVQDYRGYPFQLYIDNYDNFPLSDEILRMKNVRIYFRKESKPIHKLVSPEPHFVEEERDLIENHFSYLGDIYKSEDIEEWRCFQMDCEGHLVSLISLQTSIFQSTFQLSNESIEHLSNFPHLRELICQPSSSSIGESVTNLSLLTLLKSLTMNLGRVFNDPDFFKDLGLFTNLLYLSLQNFISRFKSL